MSNADDIREFLTTRRAKVTPQGAGLPMYGRKRRVPGLRREEVALLAGISVEWYTRLERGNAKGVSDEVLDAVATSLQLDEAERAHLGDLVRTANAEQPTRRPSPAQRVRPGVARVIDGMVEIPAYVMNGRLDILYANPLAEALFSEVLRDPVRPANFARFLFLDPRSRTFWLDWNKAANDTVAVLRSEAGRNPYDRSLSDLIGQLSTRSDEFRVRWAAHDVRFHRVATKQMHHPLVGDLTLAFEAMELPADPGLSVMTYSAEPGSRSGERITELGGWSSTREKLAAARDEVETPNTHT